MSHALTQVSDTGSCIGVNIARRSVFATINMSPRPTVHKTGPQFALNLGDVDHSREDTISIDVLLDRSSAEWKWVNGIYDQLNDAVSNDGAKLVVYEVR